MKCENILRYTVKYIIVYSFHASIVYFHFILTETFRKSIDCKCVSKPIISAMLTLDRNPEVQEYGCMALTNLTANGMYIH